MSSSPIAPGPYRIRAVSEITGVPEPTLRAWERRYGIPAPERTDSGYRLYDAGEVMIVREMRRLTDEGMAAAEAAALLRRRQERAFALDAGDGPADPYAILMRLILDAVESFDDAALRSALRQTLFSGDAGAILDRVVGPALRTVGDKWHAGELSVAQEHFASQRLQTFMRDLLQLLPGSDSGAPVLCAAFADDQHELGCLALAVRIAGWGYRPVFLGARTPPGAVRDAIGATNAALVLLSVTVPPEPSAARALVDDYASACHGVPWIVGGPGKDEIAEFVRARGGEIDPEDPAKLHALVQSLTSRTKSGRRKPTDRGSR